MRKVVIICAAAGLLLSFVSCEQQEVQPLGNTQANLVELNSDLGNDADANSRVMNFVAHLSGGEEVPPVDTRSVGQVKFQLSQDGSSLYYKLIVSNMSNVRFSHIHWAPAGSNGPVVVTLFPGPTQDRVNGILAEGNITSGDLAGPLVGMSLDVLLEGIKNGMTYVNVHTDQFPPGEVRGQIR